MIFCGGDDNFDECFTLFEESNRYFENNNNLGISRFFNSIKEIDRRGRKFKKDKKSLEDLLTTPQILYSSRNVQEEINKKTTLNNFVKKNINNLKEELVYYYSPIESLSHLKSSSEEDIKYDFYKDLRFENFLKEQNERFEQILLRYYVLESKMKISKLSNLNDSFCSKASLIKDNEGVKQKIVNANKIGNKMDENLFLFPEKEINEDKLINYLKELKEVFTMNIIDMESLGYVQFNFIEKNLISILSSIERVLLHNKNKNNINIYFLLCLAILECFKSTKLFFYIIRFLKQYNDILDFTRLNTIKNRIQFIPNNCFDFNLLNQNIQKVLIDDLEKPLIDKGHEINFNSDEYIKYYKMLSYDNYLLLFLESGDCLEEVNESYIYYPLFYYKIDLINEKIIDTNLIPIYDEEEKNNPDKSYIDINISLRNEIIYLSIIIEYVDNYYLKCILYNKYSMNIVKESRIDLRKDFIPIYLYNDNKYIYCISDENQILMIKKDEKLDIQKYIICSFRLYNEDLNSYQKIEDLSNFEMYNSLYINNIFFLNNTEEQKCYMARLISDKNDEYLLNIYDMGEKSENNKSIKIAFNDNKFIITKISEKTLYYDVTSKDFNHLIDKGISLLPFQSNISYNIYPDNFYEYLIQEYASFLNLCGNFELINAQKEQNLIKYPFSLCCNFDKNVLNLIIGIITENDCFDNTKLHYLIILKQIICSLYNVEIPIEESIEKLKIYFKNLILKMVNSKENKLFNKMFREIMEISSYMEDNNIIEINEIKCIFNNENININNKSKFLLMKFILGQNNIEITKELYDCILQLEMDYLIDIFKEGTFKTLDLSLYKLYKNIMIDSSESLYKRVEDYQHFLITLIPHITENICIIIDKIVNNYIEELSFLYNSFNFRCFFIIIEYLLANKIFLPKKEYIIAIYKLILTMDKNSFKFNDCFDLDNIVEIINYLFLNEEAEDIDIGKDNIKMDITLKEPKNIIIETSILSNEELANSIKLTIHSGEEVNEFEFEKNKEKIYHNVNKINVEFTGFELENKSDYKINIIPLKDEKLYNLYIKNKDLKIINLIKKCAIHYLMYLFDDIDSEIKKYDDNEIIKGYKKIFQSEIFKCLSIPMNKYIKKNYISNSQFNNISNKLLEKLNETIDNMEEFNSLNNELQVNFNKINRGVFGVFRNEFEFKINSFDEVVEKTPKILNINNFDLLKDKNLNKLFKIFNYDLPEKKKIYANQMIKNDNLNILLRKIFLFGVKYYNCSENLYCLIIKVAMMTIEDIKDIEKNINEIRTSKNYSLFLSFYIESLNIKEIYDKYRNNFNVENFEEENKSYFDENKEKIDFLLNYIIPCDDVYVKPDSLIIKNLLEIIDNSNIGIYEIMQNIQIRNISSQIKLIKLMIINNFLLYLNDETDIIFILNFINKKKSHNSNVMYSIFEDTQGSDYFNIEKMKYQFHLFLKIISSKLNKEINYSNITKICLIENFIWKIKMINFPIIFEIIKIFEEIKDEIKIDKNNYIFNFESELIYNVNYYNRKKCLEYKFEVFKQFIYQIMNILKDNYKYKEEKENDFISLINKNNSTQIYFQNILDKIMSFFIDINPECVYYDDLILLFYKIFCKSDDILNLVISNNKDVIKKIMKISFYDDDNGINNKTKLIMIKILCKIIKNINNQNLNDLSESIQTFENKNIIINKPLIFLYEKILNELNNNNIAKIIHNYYINLLFICINKIYELEQDKIIIDHLINNKNILNIILFSNNFIFNSENHFIIKPNNLDDSQESKDFEDIALFNSVSNESIKKGKILCFVDNKFNNYIKNSFISNYNNYSNFHSFTKLNFSYSHSNLNNNYKNVMVIMNNFEQLENYSISDVEIKNISELEIINTENENTTSFFKNYSQQLINLVKQELNNNYLNEKGIYLTLKTLPKLIQYIDKNELLFLLRYLWKFYKENKWEEYDYPFMSKEYIENEANEYFQLYDIKNIYKEKYENDKSLFSLFDYIIKDNILEIKRISECINKNCKILLINPIRFEQQKKIITDKIKYIYNKSYELSDLSYNMKIVFKIYERIGNNSIMFRESIMDDIELKEICEIIENNINKIKIIIVKEISDDVDSKKLIDFIIKNDIPIYQIEKKDYDKLINFFIKGEDINYIIPYKYKEYNIKERNNIFSVFKLKLDNELDNKLENNIDDDYYDYLEDFFKNKPEYIQNKILFKKNYKTSLCKYFEKGHCKFEDKCDYAHGEKEIEEIETIREYLLNNNKDNKKLKEYNNNRFKLFNKLKDESKDIFNIMNIKLSKRLICDIINQKIISASEIESIFGGIKNIIELYELLCLEYYFNLEYKISNGIFKEKLINFFKKFSNDNEINLKDNKWILNSFKQTEKIDFGENEFKLSNFNLDNLYNITKIYDIFYFSPNIIFDKLLFLYDNIIKEDAHEYFLKYYFNIVNIIFNKIVEENILMKDNNNDEYDEYDKYQYLVLSRTLNILYNYYCHQIKNNNDGNKYIQIYNIPKIPDNIDETVKKLIKINLDEYFPKTDNKTDINLYLNNEESNMTDQIAFIIESIFKYLDLCLILLFKYAQNKFYYYMISEENKNFFEHYLKYKILTMEKYNKNNDYKEIASFIYYIIELINSNIIAINGINNKNKNIDRDILFNMSINHINKFTLKNNNFDLLYNITFIKNKGLENDVSLYNKVIVCCVDEKTKQFYFQDIFDLNNISMYDNKYKLSVKNTIYLIPIKNIPTCLYRIENTTKNMYLEYNNQIKNISKYEEIPKYTWNIGFDGNQYLLLLENKQIYTFFEQENNSESISEEFYLDKTLETINSKNNEIIDFINGTEDISSLLITNNGYIFNLDENRSRYKWLTGKENGSIKSPINIPAIMLSYISVNSNECYGIGIDGLLYEIRGQNIKQIFPPDKTKKFLQCACGDGYVICLLKNENNKGVLYAKGINNEYQCGIKNNNYNNSDNKFIKQFTKCDINCDLDFKYICTYKGFSATITSCGKLFIWGLKFKRDNQIIFNNSPILINTDDSIIVDKIYLNYYILYVIGRKLVNGNYITKLFSLEVKDPLFNQFFPFTLKEINIINKLNNNSRNIPLNIYIGEKYTYCLCVDENELIEKINQDNQKNKNNKIINLLINYDIPHFKKEKYIENLRQIYNSEKLNKFLDSLNLLSDKYINELIKVIEEMKKGNIKTYDIDYNKLIDYLKNENELNELLSFFLNNESNEGIILFNYLKLRKALIEENIMNYINISNSLENEGFIQKIIEKNIIFLNEDFRVQYFYSLLLNMMDEDDNNQRKKNITIERFKALNFKEKFKENKKSDIFLSETIFGQLFHSLEGLTGKEFLREKGERLFKVNLKGEQATDVGGPYSEILSDICDELQSDYIDLFIKTPNNKNNIGELRDKYIINPSSDNIYQKKAYEFIGKLMVLAISSGETLNLNLHPIVWKSLLENQINFNEYETIDKNFFELIEKLKQISKNKDKGKDLIDSYDLNFVIQNSNEKEIELIENGQNVKVTMENIELYIELAQSKRINEFKNQIKFIRDGLYSGIEKNILQILNWKQLELMVCGEANFNIEDFKQHTKYENCNDKDIVIIWFWEWLESCKEEEKFKYLKFVSGRSRLPKSDYVHKINVFNYKEQYPASHTCFSTLDLPKYDSKNEIFKKMKFVIDNVTTINDY